MSYAVRPIAVNGLTTAKNATVSNTAAGTVIAAKTVMISVGIVSAFPIYIMFGVANLASTLTSSTGFALPAGFVGRIDVPSGSTTLYYLRAAGTNSDISILECDGGI